MRYFFTTTSAAERATPVPSRRRPRKKGTDFYEPFLRTMEETEQTSILRFFQFIVDLLFCLTGY